MVGRKVAAAVIAAGTLVAALTACSAPDETAPEAAPPPPPPPPPPAACLLDTAALAAATGLRWAPDPSTASDTRCVYDPDPAAARPAEGPVFLSVDVTPDAFDDAEDPAGTLDTVAELCEDGSRAPAGSAGFVCRYQDGNVFAAAAGEDGLVTVAASAVPEGTTAARLVVALDQQVATLSP